MIVQLCLGLRVIHASNIVHRDIKPRNIFIDGPSELFGCRVKIGDFGSSRELSDAFQCASTIVGTPYYLSPEICMQRVYDQKTDIWSLGCLIYELLTGSRPFEGSSFKDLIHRICHEEACLNNKYLCIVLSRSLSKDTADLVRLLLQKDPKKRPSASQLFSLPYIVNGYRSYCPQPDDMFADIQKRRIKSIVTNIVKMAYRDQEQLALRDLHLLLTGIRHADNQCDVDGLVDLWCEKNSMLTNAKTSVSDAATFSKSADSLELLQQLGELLKGDAEGKTAFTLDPFTGDPSIVSEIPGKIRAKIADALKQGLAGQHAPALVEQKIIDVVGISMHRRHLEKNVYGLIISQLSQSKR